MKGKLNNRGYSLVELLLTLAIFSFVMLGIAMIMRTTSVSYKDGANEVTMQTEAQIVANQVEEIFMDGTKGYCDSYIDGNRFYGITSDGASHFVIYKAAEQELWYQTKASGETVPDSFASGNWSLMAQNVSGFGISGYSKEITNASCDNMITVEVGINRGGYIYTASKDIYFRNSIENIKVTQLQESSESSDSSEKPYVEVYVDRYSILDLVGEYELDLSKPVTISGLSSSNYKIVLPNYASGNTDRNKAITSYSDATLEQCKTKGYICLVPTASLNGSFTSSVTKDDKVTVVGKDFNNQDVKLQLLTNQVSYKVQGSQGVIPLATVTESSTRLSWIHVDGIDIASMINYHNLYPRYSMVVYQDKPDGTGKYNNYYDGTSEAFTTAASKTTSQPIAVQTINSVTYQYDDNNITWHYPVETLAIGLLADPGSGDFLIPDKSTISTADVASFNSGHIRIAYMIALPTSSGFTYDIVDLGLVVQADGAVIGNTKGGFTYDASATTWSAAGF